MFTKFYQQFSSLISAINSCCQRQVKISIATLNWKQSVIAASIVMTGLVLGVRHSGWLQLLELVSFDHMVRLQADAGEDPRLLVVEITDNDIKKLNQWPISDRNLAQAFQELQKHQPKLIGLDLYRDVPQPPGREEFLKQVQADNVIGIYYIGDHINGGGVPQIPGMTPEQIGFNDVIVDEDNIVRRNFLYGSDGEREHYSFALRLVLKYLEEKNISLKVTKDGLYLGETALPRLDTNAGGYHNIDNAGTQIMVSYASPNIARRISLTEVLDGELKPEWVKDKVVLIGVTAISANDFFLTPYNGNQSSVHTTPGVLLHAQLVSQLLSITLDDQPVMWFWSEWKEVLWIWSWALIGGWLAWRGRHPFFHVIITIFPLGILFSLCFGFFIQGGWIPFISPAIALLATNITILAHRALYNTLHDFLTGLPNRQLFLQYLQWAIADAKNNPQYRFAVLFLDIDSFKLVNESFGHHQGDKLLNDFTQRLNSALGGRGILARVGGDEFAIFMENITESSQAILLADYLQQEMNIPFTLKEQEIFTSVSVGIAFNQPELEHQPADLLRDAHTAMYRAKDLGKSRHEVFATGMHTQVINRLQLEAEIRRALENEEFYLAYQPIVSLQTNQIAGFEALIRWNHPQRGFVSPGEFIPVAEETGLIIPLGQWILEEAFRQLATWQTQFPSDPPLMMSINLSGHQLTQDDLVEIIQELLNTTGVDPKSIKLEITESVAMKDVEAAISVLLKLRSLNLQLSIDDFGTGYSSLSYLHRFPITTLKIDRSFVNHMTDADEDAAIVKTIIRLSDNLGLDVVAEGIETKSQALKLHQLGSEYGQGYLFSKPVDSNNASKLLSEEFFYGVVKEKVDS